MIFPLLVAVKQTGHKKQRHRPKDHPLTGSAGWFNIVSVLPVPAALSLPERFLLLGNLIAFVLAQESLMPHDRFGPCKVQINRLGPYKWFRNDE